MSTPLCPTSPLASRPDYLLGPLQFKRAASWQNFQFFNFFFLLMSTFTNYDSSAASDYDVARLPIGADIMGKVVFLLELSRC